MRRWLDALYDGAAWLAALCMVGLLGDGALVHREPAVALQCAGHGCLCGLPDGRGRIPGPGAYPQARRTYSCDAAAEPPAGPAAARARTVGPGRRHRCWPRCWRTTPRRLAWQSHSFHDISTGNDATPLWIPQITFAVGALILALAFIDELVLEFRGLRVQPVHDEASHNE